MDSCKAYEVVELLLLWLSSNSKIHNIQHCRSFRHQLLAVLCAHAGPTVCQVVMSRLADRKCSVQSYSHQATWSICFKGNSANNIVSLQTELIHGQPPADPLHRSNPLRSAVFQAAFAFQAALVHLFCHLALSFQHCGCGFQAPVAFGAL